MSNRKRPVYVVIKPTGLIVEGEEAKIIIGIRTTSAEADTLKKENEGAIIEKQFLSKG